jgi:hypothetical protein
VLIVCKCDEEKVFVDQLLNECRREHDMLAAEKQNELRRVRDCHYSYFVPR